MITSLLLSIAILIEAISGRVLLGLSTIPTVNDWLNTIVLLLTYAIIALPFGFWLNFLQLDWQFSRKIALKVIATSLVTPAIFEELLFRVILLPQPSGHMDFESLFLYSIISLLLFVIYHPLNAITFFPNGRETFFNPVFLCSATLLGLMCTVAYLQTGSIWSPVIIHWFTVAIWLLCLRGMQRLKMIENEY